MKEEEMEKVAEFIDLGMQIAYQMKDEMLKTGAVGKSGQVTAKVRNWTLLCVLVSERVALKLEIPQVQNPNWVYAWACLHRAPFLFPNIISPESLVYSTLFIVCWAGNAGCASNAFDVWQCGSHFLTILGHWPVNDLPS